MSSLLQKAKSSIIKQQSQKIQKKNLIKQQRPKNNMELGEDKQAIPSDKYVILVDNRNEQRLIKLSSHKKFNWRKTQINLQQLKKQPFYQLLQVGNNSLKPIDFQNPDDESEVEDNEDNDNGQVKQNNKEMYTLEDAQKLQTQDIQKLKKQKTPEQLIKQLTENNQQFEKRTAYSKAKYLKKKQKKYIFNFHAEPVCLQNLHDYYFKNDLKMIGGIRWDMMGLLLLHAGPFKKVLLAQKTKGIVLGSTLVKGAQQVNVISFEQKNIKAYPIVEQLNLNKDDTNKVTFHTWESLKTNQSRPTGHDSFILFGNYDFSSIINTVEELKLLSSYTSVAFFCLSIEPILECFSNIRKNYKNYLNVKIFDSWCREYQVLKNRTHPLMYMDSRSGYLLTAIRVNPR